VDGIISFDLQCPLKSNLLCQGLELWLDAEDLKDRSAGDVVISTWKSRDPSERAGVVRNRHGCPTLSKLDGKLCVPSNYNRSVVIHPPLTKIQTMLSVHTFQP
jgi:hypothetical protein